MLLPTLTDLVGQLACATVSSTTVIPDYGVLQINPNPPSYPRSPSTQFPLFRHHLNSVDITPDPTTPLQLHRHHSRSYNTASAPPTSLQILQHHFNSVDITPDPKTPPQLLQHHCDSSSITPALLTSVSGFGLQHIQPESSASHFTPTTPTLIGRFMHHSNASST